MQKIEGRFGSAFFKCAIVSALALLMLLPLAKVESVVTERQELRQRAYELIAEGFGGEQVVGAPVLSVATEERSVTIDTASGASREVWRPGPALHLLPDEVHVASEVTVELRHKGIYEFPVYVSQLVISGEFKHAAVTGLLASTADTRVLPARATVELPLTGIKFMRALNRFEFAGRELAASGGAIAGLPALSAPIELAGTPGGGIVFRVELQLAGSDTLHFLPLGATTVVTSHVGWPNADFDGAFLPAKSDRTGRDFSARWQVLGLNRAVAQHWRGDAVAAPALLATAFGFRLYQPADLYAQNYRAVHYGVLFIAITFACFFAWEQLMPRLRLHGMHYLLVGLALATFYLLLLALSEQLGFGAAYAIAATALVTLLGAYTAGITGEGKSAAAIGAALAAAYGCLYLILRSEDDALLLGSLLLFTVLAILMLATRRLDWSAVGGSA